jgi:tetratricopeptide (TPR) repeat protein
MMQKAVQLAPKSWVIQFNLGTYLEATDQSELADEAYSRALTLTPDVALYPEWQHTKLRQKAAVQTQNYTSDGRAILLMQTGDLVNADRVWEQKALPTNLVNHQIVGEILALANGDLQAAELFLASAKQNSSVIQDRIWVEVGNLYIAKYNGDQATLNEKRRLIADLLFVSALDDYNSIATISYTHYWTLGLPQYFIPQSYSPYFEPLVVNLLEHSFDEF